ncbi:glycine cleavage system aminomethyltransferase GcvT [Domibacillus sp. A3M-37]|uniref:glycine cleavage system aminomethyltransferase GcvT n=1 Tax=Domibacillus sp. A3M-37 TaxID=2962037 RepID=UPI0020B825E6|nr:glycine cleavage system aminomethyltransferase GcvT [Domibacillus sp. A3M-37]MCP3761321.1 glycine cleavage system aminomethyltransferase GcvT [Domibacillus sp. A3M-37]
MELKKTPLFNEYEKLGAKVIDFGGWALPVQFTSIMGEHEAVRTNAGLFDVSHMGEVLVNGDGAEAYINHLVTNDVSVLEEGQAQYTAMCYEDGGTVDDLLVYKKADDEWMLVINAANIAKDVAWLKQHILGDVTVTNVSDETALLAVQGPKAERILQKLTDTDLSAIGPFRFAENVTVGGVDDVLVSRTGYTGEDGFELYMPAKSAAALWQRLAEEDITLCGLGARDTLRLEARLPLYGQELSAKISPLEAGIGFAVKTAKQTPFLGQDALQQQKETGLERKTVGIEMIDRGIPRTGYQILSELGEPIGFVTSGTHSPTLKKPIGLAIVNADFAGVGTKFFVEIRQKQAEAVVVSAPFYKRERTK